MTNKFFLFYFLDHDPHFQEFLEEKALEQAIFKLNEANDRHVHIEKIIRGVELEARPKNYVTRYQFTPKSGAVLPTPKAAAEPPEQPKEEAEDAEGS